MNTKTATQETHRVLTHVDPHVDELTGNEVVKRMNAKHGIITVIDFVSNEEAKEIISVYPNTIALGVGGSESDTDEHTVNGEKKMLIVKSGTRSIAIIPFKKEITSSIEMLIENFGIEPGKDMPGLAGLIDYAHRNDTYGAKNMLELGNIVKLMHKSSQYTNQDVVDWFSDLAECYEKSYDFFGNNDGIRNVLRGNKLLRLSKEEYAALVKKTTTSKSKTYGRFVLSYSATINDVVAVKIAKKYGKESLGTSYKTPVIFVNANKFEPSEGDLCIGFGGELFSAYPAEIMATVTGIRSKDFRVMKLVMDYIRNLNSRPGYGNFELGLLFALKMARAKTTQESWSAFMFASKIIDLLMEKQANYLEALNEFLRRRRKRDGINTFVSSGVRLCMIKNGTPRLNNVAFSLRQNSADIVISKNNNGQVIILMKKHIKQMINCGALAATIRRTEAYLAKTVITDQSVLYSDGKLDEIPEWYYQIETGFIMNGSLTHPDIPATKIPLQKIVNMVTKTIELSQR